VARLFAAEGARVVIADVQDEAGARVAADIGTSASYARHDVTREPSWQDLVEAVVRDLGRVDVLVNNAGVLHMAALEDTSLVDYERVVRVNQVGPFLGMKAVAKVMKAAGRGAIVNISSIDGMSASRPRCSARWRTRSPTSRRWCSSSHPTRVLRAPVPTSWWTEETSRERASR
jgi:3alpha(or 20beta)-hydroxysteroid dehydrogenase